MNTQTHGAAQRRSLWKSPAIVTVSLLLIPLLGNQFVEGWHWELRGFVLFGTIIFGIGLTYQLVTRNVDTSVYRAAVGLALVTGFLLFWGNFVQSADEINPFALLYFLTLPVGIIGAVLARFRPEGMARALFATALAQAVLLVIVLLRNPPVSIWTAAVWRGFGGNAFFVVLFVASAWLFRIAARAAEDRKKSAKESCERKLIDEG